MSEAFSVPIIIEERSGLDRSGEVVRFSVPLPRGLAGDPARLALTDERGEPVAHQLRPVAYWADRSVKWLLVDGLVTVAPRERRAFYIRPAADNGTVGGTTSARGVSVEETADVFRIRTGVADFEVRRNLAGPLAAVLIDGIGLLQGEGSRVELIGVDGQRYTPIIERSFIEERGPVTATIVQEGTLQCAQRRTGLSYRSRASFSAGSTSVRLDILIRNTQAARHPGGLWDLGDPGSSSFKDLSVGIFPASTGQGLRWYSQSPEASRHHDGPDWVLYQDSSGGDRWNSNNHVDAAGRLTVAFQGYQVRGAPRGDRSAPGSGAAPGAIFEKGAVLEEGRRATPCLSALGEGGWVAATVKDFWQSFPKALRFQDGALQVSLFPGESRAPFELQGGEQKRHTVWLDFGRPHQQSAIPGLQSPLSVTVDAGAIARSRAVRHLVPRAQDRNMRHLQYVDSIIEGPNSFFAKREIIDEYGWRNFGDLYADHEAVRWKGPQPLVSHYNNQYDFIQAAAINFLRSGDARWRDLLEAAARHTIDIDIYHTDADRSAYNGGLFWHTDHYQDAATCTHRCYSGRNAGSPYYGGGPSNEHNYTTGLVYYHYLTGDPEARSAVLGLADWAIAMDDGKRTLLGLFDPGPTGFASKTVSESYHKPGRGAGNSINALLDGYALSDDRRYMQKAEELIQRCIHPADDIGVLQLSEPERRWSYLVFLQVLGKYLDVKVDLGELDYGFHYARESLLHYADWMMAHEVPYKDVLHKVEIPTETWPAHDVRKCHVLHIAARYSPRDKQAALHERATFFFQRCIEDVLSFDTAYVTRPLVLLSVHAHIQGYFESELARGEAEDPAWIRVREWGFSHNYSFGCPVEFIPQRERWKSALREKLQVVSAESRRRARDVLHSLKTRLLPRPSRF